MSSGGSRLGIQIFSFLRVALPIAAFLAAAAWFDVVGGTLGHGAPFKDEVLTGSVLMGCIMFPVGTFLIADGLMAALRARDAVSWPTFPGEVLSSGISRTITYGMVLSYPEVSYRYEVNGQRLENDTIESTHAGYYSARAAHAQAARYPVGAKVKVYVDPQDVTLSMLETGHGAGRRRVIIGMVTLALPFVLGPLFAGWNSLGG